MIKRALAEEWKRRESETRREEEEGAEELERRAAWKGTFQSPEIEETKHFRHVTPAADRTSLPDPCDPEKAAGYLGISKSTAYEWIRRKKWGIQTDLLDGRRMIPLSEIKRLKRAMLEKEERIETIQKERGIRRASALRRLKRGLEKAQPESD